MGRSSPPGIVHAGLPGRGMHTQKPSFVRDDATGKSLDPAKANSGMAKEIRALDSLSRGCYQKARS